MHSEQIVTINKILHTIPSLMAHLSKHRGDDYDQASEEILTELLRLEPKARSIHQQAVSFYQCVIDCSKSIKKELLLKYTLPIAFKAIQLASYQPKIMMVQYFASLTKEMVYGELRFKIRHFMTNTMACSSSFKDRLMYIDFCLLVSKIMSKSYFKEYFLGTLNTLWKGKTIDELFKLSKNAVSIREAISNSDQSEIDSLLDSLSKCANLPEKRHQFVRDAAKESLKRITNPAFAVSDENQKALIESEMSVRANEEKAMEENKKQEIEHIIKLARIEVASKLGGASESVIF